MLKHFIYIALVIFISGCSNKTPYDVDLKNSPCACNYSGEQLITNPSPEELKKVADLQLS